MSRGWLNIVYVICIWILWNRGLCGSLMHFFFRFTFLLSSFVSFPWCIRFGLDVHCERIPNCECFFLHHIRDSYLRSGVVFFSSSLFFCWIRKQHHISANTMFSACLLWKTVKSYNDCCSFHVFAINIVCICVENCVWFFLLHILHQFIHPSVHCSAERIFYTIQNTCHI